MMYVPETNHPGLSRTALGICGFCAMINRNPAYRPIFYDPFAERLFSEAATDGQAILDVWHDWDAVLAFADTHDISRRLVLSILWRKTFMQTRTRDALAAGVEQVVVLGAGLDTLSLRLSQGWADVPVFEVDRPDTLATKRDLVQRNFGLPPNARYVAVDFARETTLDKLQEHGYDHAKSTIFIAEVSLEYVPPPDVAQVYAMIRSNTGPLTRFLTTYADTAGQAAVDGTSDGIGAAVADAGEPFRFHVAPTAVADYVASQGFELSEHIHGQDGTRAHLSRLGVDLDTLPFDPATLDRSSFSLAHLVPRRG